MPPTITDIAACADLVSVDAAIPAGPGMSERPALRTVRMLERSKRLDLGVSMLETIAGIRPRDRPAAEMMAALYWLKKLLMPI